MKRTVKTPADMADVLDFDASDSAKAWANLEYTKGQAEWSASERKKAIKNLIAVCQKSTDPEVQRLVGRVLLYDGMYLLLTGRSPNG